MEHIYSLPCSQGPSTFHYPNSVQPSLYHPILSPAYKELANEAVIIVDGDGVAQMGPWSQMVPRDGQINNL
jgi:hypothetical protein